MQAVDLGLNIANIAKPVNRLFCRLDGLTTSIREQKRLDVLRQLNFLAAEAVPVFEEATQTASAFLEAPICILGLVVERELWFKSAVGLSTIGLMNQLASYRKLPLAESFSTYVVDSEQPLAIDNTAANGVFANSILTQHYGIKAYLGVPLISSEGLCLGTLEVMDLESRNFTLKDIDFLALTARWCLREFERNHIIRLQQDRVADIDIPVISSGQPQWNLALHKPDTRDFPSETNKTNSIETKLLAQLTQELRTPLTSVIGMASVLRREVYGPLTTKQREYLEIIHNSGQNLISLVDEIISLGGLGGQETELKPTAIDIEMLCQQVINSLIDTAEQHQQSLRLSIEPGNRIWSLDKEKVRQALYYLILSVVEMSEAGGEVRIHVSHRHQMLNITVWFSHPWLGEGLPQIEFAARSVTKALALNQTEHHNFDNFDSGMSGIAPGNKILTSEALMSVMDGDKQESKKSTDKIARDFLGLLFSCHLAELHEGRVIVQGSPESGYRYVLQFLKAKVALESTLE